MKITSTKLGILTGAVATLLAASPVFAAAPTQDSSKTPPPTGQTTNTGEQWSDRIFDEFQQMQTRMEKLFNDATRDIDQSGGVFENNGFTSSVKLSEDKGDYVVHLALPERDLKNLDVTVDNSNVLHITAKEEKKEAPANATQGNSKTPAPVTYEIGRYEQLLTLPGKVDASKMKVDRVGDGVTITLPKTS